MVSEPFHNPHIPCLICAAMQHFILKNKKRYFKNLSKASYWVFCPSIFVSDFFSYSFDVWSTKTFFWCQYLLISSFCFISILLFPPGVSYSTTLLTQGLILLACLALLAPSMAAPAPTFDPITAASFTAAGGLVCSFDILYMSSSNTIWFLRSWPPLPARPWPCQRRRSWLGRRWPSRDSCSRPSPTERDEWGTETGYMCNKRPLAY